MKLTTRSSLLSSLSLLSASLLVGAGSARAQECTADADCDEDFECVHYGEESIVDAPPMSMMPSVTPSSGASAPPPANCDGEGCNEATMEGETASEDNTAPADDTSEPPPVDEDRVAVRPEATDGGAPGMEPAEGSMGSCQPVVLSCSESADCPDPAVCEGGECVFLIERCEEDAECGAGFVCTVFSTSGTCSTPAVGGTGTGTTMPSGNPVATDPATMAPVMDLPGEGTPATMSEGSSSVGGSGADPVPDAKPLAPESNGETSGDSEDDPDSTSAPAPGGTGTTPEAGDMAMCTVTENRACFPAPVACSSDADCDGDWTCEDVTNVVTPRSWAGVDQVCLPPALTAAIAGHVNTGGDVIVSQDSNGLGGSEPPRAPTDVDGTPIAGETGSDLEPGTPEPNGNMNEVESPVELGTQGGTEGSMGCSTGSGSPRGGNLTWLAALGALVFASRRRQRR